MSQPTSVTELRSALDAGLAPNYLFFWGHTAGRREGPKGPADGGRTNPADQIGKECLSQWYPAPFEVEGVRYPTAEHYMMYQKAVLFGDEASAEKMLAATTPAEVKALGRGVTGFDEGRWVAARFDIVVVGNINKFYQNSGIGAFLRGTGKRILVEASPRDAIWGIGLAEGNPAARDPARWPGQNLLGFALMVARARLAV